MFISYTSLSMVDIGFVELLHCFCFRLCYVVCCLGCITSEIYIVFLLLVPCVCIERRVAVTPRSVQCLFTFWPSLIRRVPLPICSKSSGGTASFPPSTLVPSRAPR